MKDIGSIYDHDPGPVYHSFGQVQAIGIGHGGDGDPEFRPRQAADRMKGDRLGILEVPSSLTVQQFLEIQTSGGQK
jgi:hypothetical protein